ncbi:MAG: helix-turn-helix transcriptional regulator [Oscillospiraceae bacterium]|jgi:transcriptional regulator with XRE-family HTH domain|nr:helix-turn-helix transcriptional regulator [Oscillospiraceae bacterium]
MDIVKVFGTNVRRYRNEKGISQEKLAELSGLHRTYISDVERFQRSIALENIQRIADALEVETYKLFLEKEDLI